MSKELLCFFVLLILQIVLLFSSVSMVFAGAGEIDAVREYAGAGADDSSLKLTPQHEKSVGNATILMIIICSSPIWLSALMKFDDWYVKMRKERWIKNLEQAQVMPDGKPPQPK